MATTADGDLKNLAAKITPEMLKQLNALVNKPSVPPLVTATVVVDHSSPFKIVDVHNAAEEVKKLSDTMERQVDRTDVTKVVLDKTTSIINCDQVQKARNGGQVFLAEDTTAAVPDPNKVIVCNMCMKKAAAENCG